MSLVRGRSDVRGQLDVRGRSDLRGQADVIAWLDVRGRLDVKGGLEMRGTNIRNIYMSIPLIHRLLTISKNIDFQVQKVAEIVVK